MRAVNLIPREERGGVGAPTRSGGAVYVVLGGLATALLAAVLYVLALNGVTDRHNRLARVHQQAAAAQTEAARLAPFAQFAQLEAQRVSTVQQLAASRFRWHQVMGDLARVLPSDVALTAFTGSLSGSSGAGGSASTPATAPTPAPASAAAAKSPGSPGATAGAAVAPTLSLSGCARSQDRVATLIPRLRLVSGVTDVTLGSSTQTSAGAAGTPPPPPSPSGGTGAGASASCPKSRGVTFQLTLSFVKPGAAPTSTSTGALSR